MYSGKTDVVDFPRAQFRALGQRYRVSAPHVFQRLRSKVSSGVAFPPCCRERNFRAYRESRSGGISGIAFVFVKNRFTAGAISLFFGACLIHCAFRFTEFSFRFIFSEV